MSWLVGSVGSSVRKSVGSSVRKSVIMPKDTKIDAMKVHTKKKRHVVMN